jgi:hypothetical protein
MWICVKESEVVLTPDKVALQGRGGEGNHAFFTCDFYNMAGGLFFEVLEWLGAYSNFAHVKPFPGVDPVLGKILVAAFLVTLFFTWPGLELLADIFPVSEPQAFLMVLTAWVLFLLLFSATMFWLLLKGLFF